MNVSKELREDIISNTNAYKLVYLALGGKEPPKTPKEVEKKIIRTRPSCSHEKVRQAIQKLDGAGALKFSSLPDLIQSRKVLSEMISLFGVRQRKARKDAKTNTLVQFLTPKTASPTWKGVVSNGRAQLQIELNDAEMFEHFKKGLLTRDEKP